MCVGGGICVWGGFLRALIHFEGACGQGLISVDVCVDAHRRARCHCCLAITYFSRFAAFAGWVKETILLCTSPAKAAPASFFARKAAD